MSGFLTSPLSWIARLFSPQNTETPWVLLGPLRIATCKDVPRLALVALSGFYYSPVFHYERPRHKEFPYDSLLSYEDYFQNSITGEDSVVIVVEDRYDPEERGKTDATIPSQSSWRPPRSGQKAVVGVMSLKLAPASKRRKEYTALTGTPRQLPANLGRDIDRQHYDGWSKKLTEARSIHCPEDSIIAMLVVQPAYWRRGHATSLMKFAIELCGIDRVNVCLSSTPMGYEVCQRLNFHEVCRIVAPEEAGKSVEPLQTRLMRYKIAD